MNRFILSGEVVKVSDWDKAEKVYFGYTINTEKYSIDVIASADYGTEKYEKLIKIESGMYVIVEGVVTSKQYQGKFYPSLFANSIEILSKKVGKDKQDKDGDKNEDIPF